MFPNKVMSSKSLTDKLLPSLAAWELTDLRELQVALRELIEAMEIPQETLELVRMATAVRKKPCSDRRTDLEGISKQSTFPVAIKGTAFIFICATGRAESCAQSIWERPSKRNSYLV